MAGPNVIIPLPGATILCGTFLCGTKLCGEKTTGDDWANYSLDLDGGQGGVRFGVALAADDQPLELESDSANLRLGTTIRLTSADQPMELPSDDAQTRTGVTLTVGDIALELDGGLGYVNPVLLTFVCLDLDLDELTCTPLDLVASVSTPVDLDPVVPGEA